MHPTLRATLAATIILAGSSTLVAQQPLSVPSASGREFWLAFQKNFRDFVVNERTQKQDPAAPLELELHITSSVSASGTLEVPGLGYRRSFTVDPGSVTVVAVPKEAQLRASGVVENLGVHVVTDQPVTIYGLNRRYQSTDSYLAIPVEALGTEYRAMGYRWLQEDLISQMAIVATEDNTVVRIASPVRLRQFAAPADPIVDGRQSVETSSTTSPVRQFVEDVPSYEEQSSDVRYRTQTRPDFSYDELRRTIVVPAMKSRTNRRDKAVLVADVLVDEDGSVGEVLVRHCDRREHMERIVEALRKIKYRPATKDGRAVSAWARVPIDLSVRNFGGRPKTVPAIAENAPAIEATIEMSETTFPPPVMSPEVRVQTRSEREHRRGGREAEPVVVRLTDRNPTTDAAAIARVVVIPKEPIEVTLARGEVLQLIPHFDPSATSDLSGTLVQSTKPVAVFSGHNCSYVPDLTVKACNLLAEQMPPVSSWGTTFGVGRIEARSYSMIRVMARKDSTLVALDGKEVATLKAGEFFEHRLVGNGLVVASRPVLVAQFAPGFDNGDNVGDPMMIVVPPVEQFDNVYSIATPVRGPFRHFVNIIARTSTIEELAVDGHPVDQRRFKQLGTTDYSVGQIEIPYGSHVVSGRERFGLYQYGLGFDEAAYDAYGNAGGQLFIDLDAAQAPGTVDRELPDIGLLGR